MTLKPGARLGPYEISGPLGAGGMGEVYRARDAKLDRDIALKILPAAVAHDPDRRARFEREARLLASLSHPNIAHIYGFEDANGLRGLAMELIEGPTLAERLAGGPIALDETLRIARQIADGLEAAHEQGIVHRDLKPSNVKVRDDGGVKVLDFGLAKAIEPMASGDPSNSPTLTSPAMTEMGMILGTAAYAAPEQVQGRRVDERADVWAFGCVLFEMLTGHRAFSGTSVSDTIAAVLRSEPDWTLLPADTPPAVRRVLQRCLVKDRKNRLGDMTAVRLDLAEASGQASGNEPAVAPPRARIRVVPIVAAAVIGAAITAGLASWLRPDVAPPAPARLVIDLPAGLRWFGNAGNGVAISRDGRFVAYLAVPDAGDSAGRSALYLRPLDRNEALRVQGSDGAYGPFFSPDSREVGFFAEGKLWRAPVTGGAAFPIGPADPVARGAVWGPDGFIYAGGDAGLTRVPISGGAPEQVTRIDRSRGEVAHRFPEVLPDGRSIMFTSLRDGLDETRIEIADLETKQVRTLIDRPSYGAKYSSTGHVLFVRGGVLMAATFDLATLGLTGSIVPIVSDVAFNNGGASHFGVSPSNLLYMPGRQRLQTTLLLVDRSGRSDPVGLPAGAYTEVALSGDGRRVALTRLGETAGSDIVIWNEEGRSLTPLTRDAAALNADPVWMPDSETVVFSSRPKGVGSPAYLFRARADGQGTPQRISPADVQALHGGAGQFSASVSSDGADLFFSQGATDADGLYVLRLATSRTESLLAGRHTWPMISPDGRRMMYVEELTRQLWGQSYPDAGEPRRPISPGAALSPRWSADGREVFFLSDSKLMVVAVDARSGFANVRPQPLFESRDLTGSFDVSRDGRHLYVLRTDTPARNIPHILMNWLTTLAPQPAGN